MSKIHVLITIQDTGANGQEYTLSFIGQNGWSGVDNSLKFFWGSGSLSSFACRRSESRESDSGVAKRNAWSEP